MRRSGGRIFRWWATALATYYVVLAGVFDDPALRWTSIGLTAIFAFIAGWQWREWTTQRRLMRMMHEAAATLAAEAGEFRRDERRAAADELTRMRDEEGL